MGEWGVFVGWVNGCVCRVCLWGVIVGTGVCLWGG